MLCARGAQVFDGVHPELRQCDVLIDETGKITQIGNVGIDGETANIDLSGYTLIPGMIDTHVHLCLDAGIDPFHTITHESRERTVFRAVSNAKLCLISGVTTVRDCCAPWGIDLELQAAIEDGLIPGPRIYASGACLTITGGHSHAIGLEVDNAEEIRKAVRSLIKQGVDQVKVMATGGVITRGSDPGATQFSVEEISVIVKEAARSGRRVVAHAQGTEGIRNSTLGGVTSVEHGIFLNEEVAQLMKDRGTYLVSTMTPSYVLLDVPGAEEQVPDWIMQKARQLRKHHWNSAELAIKMGLLVAAGTDAGTALTPHGHLFRELQLLVERGMAPFRALQAATKWASELIGCDQYVGTLEVGKLADLVAVRGNPLEDIRVVSDPFLVMKGGRIYKDRTGMAR